MDYVIFDLDGTLANIEHRLHHIKKRPKDYEKFYGAVMDDEPIGNMILLAQSLFCDIVILTGRRGDRKTEEATLKWLKEHDVPFNWLIMRRPGDYRPDHIVKWELFTEEVRPVYGCDPTIIFEDRKRVIDMWIEKGLHVADVSQGKGNF